MWSQTVRSWKRGPDLKPPAETNNNSNSAICPQDVWVRYARLRFSFTPTWLHYVVYVRFIYMHTFSIKHLICTSDEEFLRFKLSCITNMTLRTGQTRTRENLIKTNFFDFHFSTPRASKEVCWQDAGATAAAIETRETFGLFAFLVFLPFSLLIVVGKSANATFSSPCQRTKD